MESSRSHQQQPEINCSEQEQLQQQKMQRSTGTLQGLQSSTHHHQTHSFNLAASLAAAAVGTLAASALFRRRRSLQQGPKSAAGAGLSGTLRRALGFLNPGFLRLGFVSHHPLAPLIEYAGPDGRKVKRIERFGEYVVRQLGIPPDLASASLLAQAADDYVKGDKSAADKSRENLLILATSACATSADGLHEGHRENAELAELLIDELDRFMLSYFGFHWQHAPLMIDQILKGPDYKPRLKDIVLAVTRQDRFRRVVTALRPKQRLQMLVEEMRVLAMVGEKRGGGEEEGRIAGTSGGSEGVADVNGHSGNHSELNGMAGSSSSRNGSFLGGGSGVSESDREDRSSSGSGSSSSSGNGISIGSGSQRRGERHGMSQHLPSPPPQDLMPHSSVPPKGQVLVPAAEAVRSPVLLLIGGGMGAGKSTAVKEIMKRCFWSKVMHRAVVVEADAFKEKDVIFRTLSASDTSDVALVSQLVHEESTRAAAATLVTALNEGRDVIFDGTMSWQPFVMQTIAMARAVHETRFRMGPGFVRRDDGSIEERYWEAVGDGEEEEVEAEDGVTACESRRRGKGDEGESEVVRKRKDSSSGATRSGRLPYRIEVVGVVCDAHLAVARGMRRAILTRRGVPVEAQLRSHVLFARSVEEYCKAADCATIFSTNAIGGPPQLIGYKDGSPLLVDREAFDLIGRLKEVNTQARNALEVETKRGCRVGWLKGWRGGGLYEAGDVWRSIVMSPCRKERQQRLRDKLMRVQVCLWKPPEQHGITSSTSFTPHRMVKNGSNPSLKDGGKEKR